MKRVLQYKRTNIASAPDELSKAINKYSSKYTSEMYSKHNSRVADLIHCHNKFLKDSRSKVLQYHSEPFQCDVNLQSNLSRLVISQYHATLPEYKSCSIVRNVIDIYSDLYKYKEIGKIRIGYSPSIKHSYGKWHDKGYEKTVKILNRVKRKHNVEVDIIHGVSLNECIKRKSMCSIIIDECVTDSYHRSGLEGLSLGKYTICSMSDSVSGVFLRSANAETNPFNNVYINDLESHFDLVLGYGIEYINQIGYNSKRWMESHWNPSTIVKEYEKIYDLWLD